MNLSPQICRSVLHFIPKQSRFRCLHANLFTTAQGAAISNEVLTVMETVNPMEDALEKLAPFLSSEIVNDVMREQRRPELGFRFFIWTTRRRSFRSWVTHNLVIDMLAKDDGFDTYWKILEELKNSNIQIPPPTFSVLIAAYAKSGMAEKAVESFGKMKDFGCKPDVFTYNSILHVMVQKEVFLLALAVYNQMLKLNYNPNRATFVILLNGLCKNGKTDDALKMFDEMTQKGIPPNTMIYTIILSGLCQAKRTDDVHRLLNTMKVSGCCPDSITCNALLDGFCKLGQIDEAFALLQLFEKEGYVLGIKGYSSLIDGLFRAKRYDEVQEWCRKMFKAGIEPDVVLYTILIRGFCEVGMVDYALNMLNDMTQRGLSPDTYCYNALIKGFCDVGLLDKARSLQLEISKNDCFPTSCTYTILICGMCRNGLLDEARQIFNQMENLGCSPSIMTFNALIDGLCKAGELEEARHLFYKMEIGKNPSLFLRLSQGADRVMDTASLQTMVERLCESGLILKAYKLLMQLADSGVVPDIMTYNVLINGFCKAKNINGAFKLFRELQLKGHSPDSVTYGTLIDGFHRVDREEDAFRVLDQMVKNGCTPSSAVYKCLMTWSCRKGKLSVAFSLWLKYLRSLPSQEDETLKLAEEHLRRENWKKRRSEEALKIFLVLKECQMDVNPPSCVMLINGLCKDGNLEMAVDIFLYTLEKGFMLMPRICNQLLRKWKMWHLDETWVLQGMAIRTWNMLLYLTRSGELLQEVDAVDCHPCILRFWNSYPTDISDVQSTGSEAVCLSSSEDAQFVSRASSFVL
ncbi:Pentatricopeptide repeat-containing protein [Vitis vinifera]|uniref:Pentatricopeptide repeat-containing protein n=1 Tax=Vitis vinifera TaxID=29760 RepID=A0A438JKU4_VITVI|nr:Pentatricopeptide repeat-containing protein [Vitis vinifera]